MKQKSITALKKLLDKVFSEYIRRRDSGRCFTCGKRDDWKRMQCGHFISRSNNYLRFSEINCNCQCLRCNIFLYGNLLEYRRRLIKKFGTGIDERLEKEGRKIKQFGKAELEEKISFYRLLLANKNLTYSLGNPNVKETNYYAQAKLKK